MRIALVFPVRRPGRVINSCPKLKPQSSKAADWMLNRTWEIRVRLAPLLSVPPAAMGGR